MRSVPDGAGRRGKGGEGAKRAWGMPGRVKILQNQDILAVLSILVSKLLTKIYY